MHWIKVFACSKLITLIVSTLHSKEGFCCLLPNYAVLSFFALEKIFACLQLITLIVALSQSQQHFCIFAAKLRSFQLSRTKNCFCTCLLLLRCFQLFWTKTGVLASLGLIEWFERKRTFFCFVAKLHWLFYCIRVFSLPQLITLIVPTSHSK